MPLEIHREAEATPIPTPTQEEVKRRARELEEQRVKFAMEEAQRVADLAKISLVIRDESISKGGPFGSFTISAIVHNAGPVPACRVLLQGKAVGAKGIASIRLARINPGEDKRASGWLNKSEDATSLRGIEVHVAGYEVCR